MKYNEILEEIYRIREEHARECGYDLHKIFEQLREDTERLSSDPSPAKSDYETRVVKVRNRHVFDRHAASASGSRKAKTQAILRRAFPRRSLAAAGDE